MNAFTYNETERRNENMHKLNWIFSFSGAKYSNYVRFLSSITQHNFYDTYIYTTIVVYISVMMQSMKELSGKTTEAIILQVQDYCFRLLWGKARSEYKDHDHKEVTWNNIGRTVELPGLGQIIHTFS